jgi:hypothetical protein
MVDEVSAAQVPTDASGQRPRRLYAVTNDGVGIHTSWDDRFAAILSRGDLRDSAAERRDRAAERRSGLDDVTSRWAWVDRYWAGQDRDDGATDRADLIALFRERGHYERAVEKTAPKPKT